MCVGNNLGLKLFLKQKIILIKINKNKIIMLIWWLVTFYAFLEFFEYYLEMFVYVHEFWLFVSFVFHITVNKLKNGINICLFSF